MTRKMKIYQVRRFEDSEYSYAFFSSLKAAKDFVKQDVGKMWYNKDFWRKVEAMWVYDGEPLYFVKEYEINKEAFE